VFYTDGKLKADMISKFCFEKKKLVEEDIRRELEKDNVNFD
jgi:hypothetical protein